MPDESPMEPLPRRVRRPHLDLRTYDQRAKLGDDIEALDKAHAEILARLPKEGPVDDELKAAVEKAAADNRAAHDMMSKQLAELGGPVNAANRAPAEEAPKEEQVDEAQLPMTKDTPLEIRMMVFKFRDLPKRVRTQAEKIAMRDAPVPVILSELEQYLQNSPKS